MIVYGIYWSQFADYGYDDELKIIRDIGLMFVCGILLEILIAFSIILYGRKLFVKRRKLNLFFLNFVGLITCFLFAFCFSIIVSLLDRSSHFVNEKLIYIFFHSNWEMYPGVQLTGMLIAFVTMLVVERRSIHAAVESNYEQKPIPHWKKKIGIAGAFLAILLVALHLWPDRADFMKIPLGSYLEKPTGFARMQKAAANGNASAQLTMGFMYMRGPDKSESEPVCEKNEMLAAEWFHKAADQGDKQAQIYLGDAYDAGRGVPEDKQKAVEWWKKASGQDDARATEKIGDYYAKVVNDYKTAIEWYLKAYEQGKQESFSTRIDEYFLGRFYERQLEDKPSAIIWYRQGFGNKQREWNIDQCKKALERLGATL